MKKFEYFFLEQKFIIFQKWKDVRHKEEGEEQFALLFWAWNGAEVPQKASNVPKKAVIS